MEVYFDPLDLTKFPGYLDRLPHKLWNPFNDHNENYAEDLVAKFLLLFPEEVELEEGVYMRLFTLHLKGKACVWFMKFPKAGISTLP